MLSEADYGVECVREEMVVDDVEAQDDVRRVLCDGFDDIRKRFRDVLDEPWPCESHLRRIATAASGLFVFASTVLKFVGDRDRGNPDAQLSLVLRFLGTSPTPGATNPLHALDLLYKQILSDIPLDNLATTKRILSLHIYYPRQKISAWALANFFGLDKASFYAALRGLHSVIDVPAPEHAHVQDIKFYHASFGDFLKYSMRSGSFFIDEGKAQADIASHSIRWYNYYLSSACWNRRGMFL